MTRMVLVDDEPSVTAALNRLLRQAFKRDLDILVFNDPRDALLKLEGIPIDIVISDFRMPSMSGLDFLDQIKVKQPLAIRMILSASYDFDVIQRAINSTGVYKYLAKPWTDQELIEAVSAAIQQSSLTKEEAHLVAEMRAQKGDISPQELERLKLEQEEPGLTVVEWGPNGEVLIPDELLYPINGKSLGSSQS